MSAFYQRLAFVKTRKLISLIILLFIPFTQVFPQNDNKVVLVIIDGARYSETLGDTTKTYTPKMWELAHEGTMVEHFYNNQYTYTSRAIPALWCGAWTDVQDTTYQGHNTQYAVLPSIFEYYRKQKNVPANACYYVSKEIESLWLPSFDPDYGPDYWPAFHSVGESDEDVASEALAVMADYHPRFLWIYFADVDHAGHSGNWSNYTGAIHRADSLVGVVWEALQSDPFYQDQTTMMVTNDHGRHDDQHGGFQGHGDGCDGCRHIEMLAIGPHVKKNFVSSEYRQTPDFAVTAAYLLEVDAEQSTGNVMAELFAPNTVDDNKQLFIQGSCAPNPFQSTTEIQYTLLGKTHVIIYIVNSSGVRIRKSVNKIQHAGDHRVVWDGRNNNDERVETGLYFYVIKTSYGNNSGKLIYMP